MTSQIIPVDPFDLIVFGGTGDLAERKLLPALYQRQRAGQLSDPTRIIGASRAHLSGDEYRAFARKAICEHVKPEEIDKDQLEAFLKRLSYVVVNAVSGDGFDALKEVIGDSKNIRAFYLAVAPALFGDIAKHLQEVGLVTPTSRIVMEKPIGRDLASARALNDQLAKVFSEQQIFRIDHYLGKETVQNLMALRFANALYEPL
jgi:glucose-6-phosphate 1-dehydrogenase